MDGESESAEQHFYHALNLYAEGRHEDAIQEYRAAIAADPGHSEALHGLARVLQDGNRYEEAIEIVNRLIALDPDDILPHTSLSILYQKAGMIEKAEAEANRARVLGWKQQLKKSGA